jgi:diguanylate cyclase (GGDEF)-like protein
MISIRKYLDNVRHEEECPDSSVGQTDPSQLAEAALRGYSTALEAMGRCGAAICPALGQELVNPLAGVAEGLRRARMCDSISAADERVRENLERWGMEAAGHYRKNAADVKDLLLTMARAAESVGERDQRCALQINEVTEQLKSIADLNDLSKIRSSLKRSAEELKVSIDRMSAEGEAALKQLRTQVSAYQAKLEEAEQIASRDALTRLNSRLTVENEIDRRIISCTTFSAAILDIDGFKRVNDEYGHVVGDDLLKQFATELRRACRNTDALGRWGGDEFIVVLDCPLTEARVRIERMREWFCGNYTVTGNRGSWKIRVEVSIGVAEFQPGETMKQLVDRADADMYKQKVHARGSRR